MAGLPQAGIDLRAAGLPDFLGDIDKALKASNAFFDGTVTGSREASQAYTKLETAAEKSLGQITALTGRLDLQKRQYEILQAELQKTAAAYGQEADETKKAQLALDRVGLAIEGTERALAGQRIALSKAQDEMQSIDGTAGKLGRAFGSMGDAMGDAAKITARGFDTMMDATHLATRTMSSFFGDLNNMFDKGAHGAGVFGEVVTGSLRRIGELATDAVVDAGRATADFVKSGISAAGDVEQMLNVLQVAGSATDAQMAQVSRRAIALGADLTLPGTSAGDATKAMLELTKAGLSVDQAMEAAKGSLQLAAAGETDAATAAQQMAAALNAFRLPATEATRITDLLAGAANASSSNMVDLAQGFNQAGFMFSATGQKVDDLAVSLAILTKGGLTGSDAGTALKNAMLRLVNPAGEAGQTMYKLGIEAYDAQGKMRPWPDIIENIRQATAPLTDEQRDLALTGIFLSDGYKAMQPLLAMTNAEMEAMYGQVTRSGQAAELAGAQMKGWNGVVEGFNSAMETLGIIIGQNILPVITPLGQKINEALGAFTSGEYTAGFRMFGEAANEAVAQVRRFIGELATGQSPLTPFIDATMAALAPLGDMLIGQARQWFGGLWEWLKAEAPGYLKPIGDTIITEATKWINKLNGWIDNQLPGVQGQLGKWAEQFAAWIEPAIPPMLEALGGLVDRLKAGIEANWPGIQTQLFEWGELAGKAILIGIAGVINGMGVFIGEWILKQEPYINNALNSWAAAFGDWIYDAGAGIVDGLARLAILTLGWLGEMPRMLGHEGLKMGEALIKGFGNAIGEGIVWISMEAARVAQGAVDAAKRALGIGSPSKVFEQLGAWTAEGMQIGLQAGTPMVQMAMASMAAPIAYPSAGSTATTNYDQRTYHYNPEYGQSVTPIPQRDSAVARSMALW